MTVIKMLGIGHGGTINLYNTCFAIQNKEGVFLVDTGGEYRNHKTIESSRYKIR